MLSSLRGLIPTSDTELRHPSFQPLSHLSGPQDRLLPLLGTQQHSQLVLIYHIRISRDSPGKSKIAQKGCLSVCQDIQQAPQEHPTSPQAWAPLTPTAGTGWS